MMAPESFIAQHPFIFITLIILIYLLPQLIVGKILEKIYPNEKYDFIYFKTNQHKYQLFKNNSPNIFFYTKITIILSSIFVVIFFFLAH